VYLEVREDVWRAPVRLPTDLIQTRGASDILKINNQGIQTRPDTKDAVDKTIEMLKKYQPITNPPTFWAGIEV